MSEIESKYGLQRGRWKRIVNGLGKSLGDDKGRCRRLSACEDKCGNYRSGIMW